MKRLLVVGGGRMGTALVGGLIRSGWIEPGDVAVAERLEGARDELAQTHRGVAIGPDPVPAESAVLAVKPTDAEAAARALAALGTRRVLSIMAGITLAELHAWLGEDVTILRAMPNLPAVLGAGASALAGAPGIEEADFNWAEGVLASLGVVVRVPENLLDAVTGLSGSGPAYLFLLAEAMIEAGVGQGLDRDTSWLLVTETLLGSCRLLSETGEPAEVLRGAVTSPGGTTAAGIGVLERHAVRSAVIEAVAAATERAHELGRA